MYKYIFFIFILLYEHIKNKYIYIYIKYNFIKNLLFYLIILNKLIEFPIIIITNIFLSYIFFNSKKKIKINNIYKIIIKFLISIFILIFLKKIIKIKRPYKNIILLYKNLLIKNINNIPLFLKIY